MVSVFSEILTFVFNLPSINYIIVFVKYENNGFQYNCFNKITYLLLFLIICKNNIKYSNFGTVIELKYFNQILS